MKNFKHLVTVMLLFSAITGYAQPAGDYFYYYKGQKFYLQTDTRNIGISIEGNYSPEYIKSLFYSSGDVLSPVQEDFTRSTVNSIDAQSVSRKGTKTWYIELSAVGKRNNTDYKNLLQNYRSLPVVSMASPCFISAEGQKMGLSNNFYVKLKKEKDVDELYRVAQEMNVEVLGHNEYMPLWFTLSCNKFTKQNALLTANIFHETGLFDVAEPAFMYHNLLMTNDTYWGNQWGLKNTGQWGAIGNGIDIKAEAAWAITTGSSTIRTAIFDHGFEMNHPDLAGNTFGTGYDAETNTTPSVVRGSHGTPCAGITGAVQNNNLGVSGVAPGTRLMSVSINLTFANTPQQLANGFNWAWQNGAAVISNSWGGYAPSVIIENGITAALDNGRGGLGTVVVFAAGNENNTNVRYPGSFSPRILVIGALSPCGERKNPASCEGENFWGSCYGPTLDVMAPGVKISTTDRQGGNGYDATDYTQTFNGTSSACPAAAGVAALVLSANPNLTVQQVTDIIEQTAQKVRTDLYAYATTGGRPNGTWHNEMGYGLVNAHAAILAAQALACAANLVVTAPVFAPNVDTRQASATITATNVINNGARGIYHAGNAVLLNPGFSVLPGGTFKAYIEGCTGVFVYRSNPEQTVYNFREAQPAVSIAAAANKADASGDRLTAMPNPFGNTIQVRYQFSKNNNKADIGIYAATGVRMSGSTLTAAAPGSVEYAEIETGKLPAGTYTLVLTSGSDRIIKKLVKQ